MGNYLNCVNYHGFGSLPGDLNFMIYLLFLDSVCGFFKYFYFWRDVVSFGDIDL